MSHLLVNNTVDVINYHTGIALKWLCVCVSSHETVLSDYCSVEINLRSDKRNPSNLEYFLLLASGKGLSWTLVSDKVTSDSSSDYKVGQKMDVLYYSQNTGD